MTSRQRAYQIRNAEHGLCEQCPRKATFKGQCDYHRWLHNARRRTEAFNAKRREDRRRKVARKRKRQAYESAYQVKRRERRRVLALMRQPWRFFGLVPPYTEDDVRRAFRRMIGSGAVKHTDHGGDGNMFRFFEAMVRKAIAAIVPMQVSDVPALPAKRKRRFVRKAMAPRREDG